MTDLIKRLREASAGTEEWLVMSEDGGIVMWYSRNSPDPVLNPERAANEWLKRHLAEGYSLGHRVERAVSQSQDQRLMADAADALVAMTAERDKYKAFAEQFASMLVEHGILKDMAPPIAGTVVHLGPQEQPR